MTTQTLSPNQTSFNTTIGPRSEDFPLVSLSEPVVALVTVALVINTVASLSLNILLIVIIQFSPSLRTPPNTHLLNICFNNLLLCACMVLCVLTLRLNDVTLPKGRSKLLSGLQLFIAYNCLLQYWATFASIGFYRHRTIKKPGLTLRSRRQLVSRCVISSWIISPLLSVTLSLSYAQNSSNAHSTLDPFMRNFYSSPENAPSPEEHVAVTLVILVALTAGLVVIVTSYFNICRTLNAVSVAGRNRIGPRQQSPNLPSDSSDLTLSVSRSYIAPYSVSPPAYLGGTLTREHKETFMVSYSKQENNVTTIDDFSPIDNNTAGKPNTNDNNSSRLSSYGQRRQLRSTVSNASTTSIRSRGPDFTDISLGADLLRFQQQHHHHHHSVHRRVPPWRESISLSSALRNSLAMLTAYCACSLPLIVVSVPGPTWSLPGHTRLYVLLACRLLFFLNAPVYPLWYLFFSVTVRKCLKRLWESALTKYRGRMG